MSLTADQLNTIYNNVLFRNVDTGGIQFFANRTDISDAQVRQQIELSAEASTFVSPIVRLYQEVLGRVPDQGGLKFFSLQLRGGTSLNNIAQQMISSTEFTSKTTATSGVVDATDLTNTNQLVSDAFASILGRQPASSEYAYFQGMTPAMILAGIANSSEAAQTNASRTITILDAFATGQTATTNPPGTTTTLTTGIDAVTVTGSNAVVTGTIVTPAANTANTSTLNAGDSITGGTGATLKIIADATNGSITTPAGVSVSNVANLSVTAVTTNANSVTLDVSKLGAEQAITLNGSGGGTTILDNLAKGAVVTLSGTQSAATSLNYNGLGTSDTVGIALNNTGTTTVTLTTGSAAAATDKVANILALTGTGTSTGSTVTFNDASLKTITINETGATKVAFTGGSTLSSLDASASTGNLNIDVTADTISGSGSFKLGSGNDTIRFASGALSGTSQSLVGGAGTDTLQIGDTAINSTTTALNSAINAASGFEVLGFATAYASGDGRGRRHRALG